MGASYERCMRHCSSFALLSKSSAMVLCWSVDLFGGIGASNAFLFFLHAPAQRIFRSFFGLAVLCALHGCDFKSASNTCALHFDFGSIVQSQTQIFHYFRLVLSSFIPFANLGSFRYKGSILPHLQQRFYEDWRSQRS